MKTIKIICAICITILSLFYLVQYQDSKPEETLVPTVNALLSNGIRIERVPPPVEPPIHLCLVACGRERLEELVTSLKSAVLATPHTVPLTAHIFTEPALQGQLNHTLTTWPPAYTHNLSYKLYDVTFPGMYSSSLGQKLRSRGKVPSGVWSSLFKPCASQRLFLPDLLPNVDAVIYTDSDTLWFSTPAALWHHFLRFNATQTLAVAPEEQGNKSYKPPSDHPFYGRGGLNTGVMLMNLTRLRQSSFSPDMADYYVRYKKNIIYGDQDLINIYTAFNPSTLHVLGCEWNFRSDFCLRDEPCRSVEAVGVRLLHGNRFYFHQDHKPVFKAVYNTFRKHVMGRNFDVQIVKTVEKQLSSIRKSHLNTAKGACSSRGELFMMQLRVAGRVDQARLAARGISG